MRHFNEDYLGPDNDYLDEVANDELRGFEITRRDKLREFKDKIMSLLYADLLLPRWVGVAVGFFIGLLFCGCFLLFYGINIHSLFCIVFCGLMVISERFFTRLFALSGLLLATCI